MIGDLSFEVRLYLQLENNLNKFPAFYHLYFIAGFFMILKFKGLCVFMLVPFQSQSSILRNHPLVQYNHDRPG